MTAKYIVVKELRLEGFGTMDMVAVVFPTYVAHSDMAYSMRLSRDEIDSAGFVDFDSSGKAHAYGNSESLSLDSQPERDTKLVQRFLGR